MKAPTCYLALVTAPDKKTARALAQAALKARLAACVNLVPQVESLFWWKGKLETSTEMLMVFKTTQACLPALQKMVLQNHPYETAEFITFKITSGSGAYLDWIADSVA